MTSPQPERVVILSDFAVVKGGASKLAVLQARGLANRDVPVTFFSGDAACLQDEGIESVAAGGRRLLEQGKLGAALGGLWDTNARRKLSEWIQTNDTSRTIYHVHGYHQTLSPSVLAPLNTVGHRTFMHAHDYFLACPNGAFFNFKANKTCNLNALSPACLFSDCDKRSYAQKLWRVTRQTIQNRARRQLLPGVTTLLIHHDMAVKLFPKENRGRVVVLPNPVDPLLDSPVSAERNQDVLFVGDIHAYKGVFLLAEAGRAAGVKIRFVGDGQDREHLARQFPEHTYEGWQNRDGLQDAMANTRMLVAPTLGPEPFGLAPVEALLSGVPVVISDSMLMSNDIVRRGMGRSFKASDVEDLAGVLGELIADDRMIGAMSEAAKRYSNELTLSSEEWCDELYRAYCERLADD